MVWPCKQNPSEKTFQISFTCQGKCEKAVGRPRTGWINYAKDLGWNRLGLNSREIMEMMKTPLKYGGSRSSAPAILAEKRAMKREKSVFKQNRERK